MTPLWLKGIAATTAVIAGFLGYIGYLGGAVFIEIPATARPTPDRAGLAAVVLSGDMGFNVGMGPRIAKLLTADGIPVIGVNSLTYFRHQRSLPEIKALIAQAAQRALAFGHARQVILIGQSFGGDALQVGLAGMPQELRSKVRLVVLIVPTETVYFRASPSEMFNWTRPDADALQTAKQLTWVPVLCIYGVEETESLCPSLRQANVRKVSLPGGHALHWNVDAIHGAISSAIGAAAFAKPGITSASDSVNIPES